jgi:hypothetical protein
LSRGKLFTFGVNCQLLLASRYVALGRTTQKIHPLAINGCPLLLRIRWIVLTESLFSNGHCADPHIKQLLQRLCYCCVSLLYCWFRIRCMLVCREFFSVGRCLPSRCLAMVNTSQYQKTL